MCIAIEIAWKPILQLIVQVSRRRVQYDKKFTIYIAIVQVQPRKRQCIFIKQSKY